MSWSEIKKAVNSDLSTPLNTLISSKATSLTNLITSRPKGYKLQLDSYEEFKASAVFDKTYTSTTGGCVRFYTNRDSGGNITVDGISITNSNRIPFVDFYSGSSTEYSEIFFNNSIRIQLPNLSSTYTMCNIAVYKYVPIT